MAFQGQGLSAKDVAERVRQGQSNDFEARVGRSYWDIIRDNVFNLFNIVLFTLLLIVLLAQDYATVVFAGFSVVTNTFLGMIQEIQAKIKLDRMASLAAQEARVWRDGQLRVLPIKQIVLDDVIAVEPGDRLAVDGEVIASDSLELDESQITGESDAIYKDIGDSVYSGSFCIAGSGMMRATKVGRDSTVNKLSAIAKEYRTVLTPTQQKIAAIVELSVLIMFILAPMLLISGYRGNETPLDIVRNGIVFVTSLVPQGLVLTAILALTIGAVKISRHRTLIQRVNAVESMANVTVLCFDKTGTLTQNKLVVQEIYPFNGVGVQQVGDDLFTYVHSLSYRNRTAGAVADYVSVGRSANHKPSKLSEIPFTSARKWGAVVMPEQTLVLGAPERIIRDESVAQQAQALAADGLRVLAFAYADHAPQDHFIYDEVEPAALIVMRDEIRSDIQATLDDFRQLDVKLKVISGDSLDTVRAIASQAGMPVEAAHTGTELDAMDDAHLAQAVQAASVFARVEPDTKRRIVRALQAQGEYVAMVGDGVNDVPALKQADLAIVMNDGTQISKDIADIVLLNNAMSTLPLAFREGREITQTIFGTTKMFLAKNVYNALLFVFIGFMALPFPITPVQISWASFGTVNMPATFIAFGIIRPKFIGKFGRDVIDYLVTAGLVGAVSLAVLFVVAFYGNGSSLEHARSAITIFICLYGMLIVWNVQGVELHNPRSFVQQWRVVLISSLAAGLTIISFYALPMLFEFVPPQPGTLVGSSIIVLITALFLLAAVLVDLGLQHRYLLERLWMLLDRSN